ncbi:MAG: hypothetical protein C9356_09400 [Oleiphilus sp.]|nr:MAG: hypothetical protein C9356_09400 [Oleiphilus sp.]
MRARELQRAGVLYQALIRVKYWHKSLNILEQGSAKDPLANSFQDVDTLRWCASQTNRHLDHLTDDQCANLLFQAVDELDRLDSLFKGEKTNATQALSWPREGVIGLEWGCECERNDSIPRLVTYGQIALACEYAYPKKVSTKSSEHKQTTRFELHTGSKALEPGFVPAFSPSQALIAPLLEKKRIFGVK